LRDALRDSDDHQLGWLLAENGKALLYGLHVEARYGGVEFHEPWEILCIENGTNQSRMDHRSSSKRVVYMLEKIDTATRQADTEPITIRPLNWFEPISI
jgi:hypothetical protein